MMTFEVRLNIFYIIASPQIYGEHGVEISNLNKNVPYRLMHLNS